MRRAIPVVLAAVLCLAAAPAALAYGWPLKPFHKAHPIRGNFGDPRTIFSDPFEPSGPFGGCALLVPQRPRHLRRARPGRLPGRLGRRACSRPRRGHRPRLRRPDLQVHAHHPERLRRAAGDRLQDGPRPHRRDRLARPLQRDRQHDRDQPARHEAPRPYSDGTKPKVASFLLREPNGKAFATRGVAGSVELIAQAYDMPALAFRAPGSATPSPRPW